MKHNPDLYGAYLSARNLSADVLLAYAEDGHRGTVGDFRTAEIDRQFRELADRLGFEIVKRDPVKEAAE